VKEWDTAAGDALLRSMGMPLVDIHTGKPLLYNKEILNSSDFTVKRK
jgi:3'-phosphoadenosine 5'-phosphosulfate (PAPS) 3'-phosphatase